MTNCAHVHSHPTVSGPITYRKGPDNHHRLQWDEDRKCNDCPATWRLAMAVDIEKTSQAYVLAETTPKVTDE